MSSRRVIPIVLTAVCWGIPSLQAKADSVATIPFHLQDATLRSRVFCINDRPSDGVVMGDIKMADIKQVITQRCQHETLQEPIPIIQPDPRETLQERLLELAAGIRRWLETVSKDFNA